MGTYLLQAGQEFEAGGPKGGGPRGGLKPGRREPRQQRQQSQREQQLDEGDSRLAWRPSHEQILWLLGATA
jgi:hypothetical protein